MICHVLFLNFLQTEPEKNSGVNEIQFYIAFAISVKP